MRLYEFNCFFTTNYNIFNLCFLCSILQKIHHLFIIHFHTAQTISSLLYNLTLCLYTLHLNDSWTTVSITKPKPPNNSVTLSSSETSAMPQLPDISANPFCACKPTSTNFQLHREVGYLNVDSTHSRCTSSLK